MSVLYNPIVVGSMKDTYASCYIDARQGLHLTRQVTNYKQDPERKRKRITHQSLLFAKKTSQKLCSLAAYYRPASMLCSVSGGIPILARSSLYHS
jgi:hypothetical protein